MIDAASPQLQQRMAICVPPTESVFDAPQECFGGLQVHDNLDLLAQALSRPRAEAL
jgi:hypothetical protein